MKINILKMVGYLVITALITLSTQLDSLNYDISSLTTGHWAGIIVKSLMPGLVTLRAYLDIPHEPPQQ